MPRLRHAGTDHQVSLLQGSREFFAALGAHMDAARTSIHLETYIFDFTASAAGVAQALMRAAARGVRVRLVVDGVGTGMLPAPWAQDLAHAGVQVHVYSPLGPLGLLLPPRWRRLHRKLCVIDEQVLFCGGINVLDDWHDPHHGALRAPRFDFAVCVRGSIVPYASFVMQKLWWRLQALNDMRHRRLAQAFADWQQGQPKPLWWQPRHASAPPKERTGQMSAAFVLRDNLRHRTRIERAYRRAIGRARHEIIIANAYFIPGRKLRRALICAAQRGVRVQLLLQGRYEYFMQYHAARPVYGALLAAGVQIYEYAPSFLHAKVAVIDAQGAHPWATVGSSNLDPLSLLLAREANVVVRDTGFARQLRTRLVHAMEHEGTPLAPATLAQRPWRERVLDRIAFALMRAALWVTGNSY